jgi:type II secretory ATPase GspE/PulE/Tfp pilus assembly ATPase PilB-like protein
MSGRLERIAGAEADARKRERLGTLLVAYGLATPQDIERGLEEQRRSGAKLGEALAKLGVVSALDVEWALADAFELRFLRIDPAAVDPAIVRLVPEAVLRRHAALPYALDGDVLVLLLADPLDRRAVVEARRLSGREVRTAMAARHEIAAAIDRVFGAAAPVAAAVAAGDLAPRDVAEELGSALVAVGAPGGKGPGEIAIPPASGDGAALVRPLLEGAATSGASRVVLAVRGDGFEAVAFRPEDAAARPVQLLRGDADTGRALLARLQALAGLPAGRPPHPVQGSFAAKDACPARGGSTVEYDLTVVPALRGEQAAIEVRRPSPAPRSLASLGLLPGDLARLRALLAERAGLIILAGEPGQGRTTLFSALLDHLAEAGRRVVSLERTVGAPSPAIVQVRRPQGDAYAPEAWVDAVLRLAPEVAAFDDIEGAEPCARAVRAALLGTLVLYALPLEDAVAAARFLESLPLGPGVAPAALIGVIAVRLVRETCAQCREAVALPIELSAAVALAGGPDEAKYSRCVGCEACDHTGSRARRPLFEVVALDKEARARIVERRGADLGSILGAARPEPIRAQAVRLAAEGAIAVDELARVL